MTESFLEKVKLSLPVGLWIENCMSSRLDAATIISSIHNKEWTPLLAKVADPQMDMVDRLQIATDMNDPWEQAIIEGYRFKFIHIGGIKRLLYFRFQLQEHRDYTQTGNKLSGLVLHSDMISSIEEKIGIQWEIVTDPQTLSNQLTLQIRLKNESC